MVSTDGVKRHKNEDDTISKEQQQMQQAKLVRPVLTKEIHQGQRALLLSADSEMKSGLFVPLEAEERRTNEANLLTLK